MYISFYSLVVRQFGAVQWTIVPILVGFEMASKAVWEMYNNVQNEIEQVQGKYPLSEKSISFTKYSHWMHIFYNIIISLKVFGHRLNPLSLSITFMRKESKLRD